MGFDMQNRRIQRFIKKKLKQHGSTPIHNIIHQWSKLYGEDCFKAFQENVRILMDRGIVVSEQDGIECIRLSYRGYLTSGGKLFLYLGRNWIAIIALMLSVIALWL